MSDLLTRLAERELGRASLVQPRIAPRFAEGPEVLADLDPDGTFEPRAAGDVAEGPAPELLALLPRLS